MSKQFGIIVLVAVAISPWSARSVEPLPKEKKPSFNYTARLSRDRSQKKGTDKLVLVEPARDGALLPLIPLSKTEKTSANWGIELTVQVAHPNASLVVLGKTHSQAVIPDGKKLYRVRIPLSGEITPFALNIVFPSGKVESEDFRVFCPDWDKIRMTSRPPAAASGQKTISLGYTSLVYQESGIQEVHLTALTFKGGISGDLGKLLSSSSMTPSPWSWGLSGYLTVLPLDIDRPDTGMRFLGLNARIGYLAPWPRSPWSLRLMGGFYYTTMFVTSSNALDSFGFRHQRGPQFQPVLSRGIGGGRMISGYLKFASIPDGFNIFDFSSREMAWGLSYLHPLSTRLLASISVDQAWLRTVIQGATIRSDSFSLSVGVNILGN